MLYTVTTQRFEEGKSKSEAFLVKAENVTDSEVKVTELMIEDDHREFIILGVKETKLNQILYSDHDHSTDWVLVTLKSRTTQYRYLVQCKDIPHALDIIKPKMQTGEFIASMALKNFAKVTA